MRYLSCWTRFCVNTSCGRSLHLRFFRGWYGGIAIGMCASVGTGCCSIMTRPRNLHLLAQRVLDLLANVLIFFQEHARILATLTHALPAVTEPRAGLVDNALVHAEIEQIALA